MRLSTVLSALGVTALLLLVANLAAHRAAANSIPRQVMREIDSAPPEIDVLGIGNSLMRSGFDTAALERRFLAAGQHVTAVNAGLGSSTAIEQLLLANRALRSHAVDIIAYGFFDQQLAIDLPKSNADLTGNHSMLYYDQPQVTLRYAPFSLLDKLEFQIYRSSSLLTERGALWAKVERLRRSMSEIGMHHEATNQFGRKADFQLLEATSPEAFAQLCRQIIQSGSFLSAPVVDLLQQAHARGAKVVVVAMPLPSLHVAKFYDLPVWQEFVTKTRAVLELHGASFLDVSRKIPDDRLYQDNLHLAGPGAARFAELLADYLIHAGGAAPRPVSVKNSSASAPPSN